MYLSRPLARPAALIALALASSSLLAQYKGALPPPNEYRAGFEAVTLEEARKHLSYLAGPECEGRGTGQPGYQKAAEYVAGYFKQLGLVPIGDDGTYFQGVPFTRTSVDAENTKLVVPGGELRIGRGLGADLGSDASVAAEAVVFLNLKQGAALPEGLQLAGKVVVVNSDGFDRRTQGVVSRANPALIIEIVDKASRPMPSISRGSGGNRGGRTRAPIIEVERRYALDLARSVGVDTVFLAAAQANGETTYREATGKIAFEAKVKTEEIKVPNVVGMYPGSDPDLKHQYIGVGAHLDHLGVSDGSTYWGADDDASGSTAVLLVAKAVATNPVKPRRSIVFMFFTGEEMGLIGSRYYADNPIMPLENMACLLQMDMVGRNEWFPNGNPPERAEDNVNTIHLVGSKRISNELHNLTLEMNGHIGFEFEWDEEDVYTRSDHYSFAAKGVPITFVFSGFHPDYHQPTDTIEKINFDKIVSVARLNYLVLQKVGALPHMVKRDAGG